MTTMTPDSCAHLGILGMFDSIFRPAAVLASQPDDEPEDEPEEEAFPACIDCGAPMFCDDSRCEECEKEERERVEADNYREIYGQDNAFYDEK